MKRNNKKFIIGGIFLFFALMLLTRMYALQVMNDDYKDLADSISIRKMTTYPLRGSIYDRDGILLVDNQPVYDIMVVPRAVKKMDTLKFCQLLDIDLPTFKESMKKAKDFSYFKASIFLKQLSPSNYAQIQESMYQFPGFFPQTRTIRNYRSGAAPHIYGYLGEVNNRDLEKMEYYDLGDYIGKTGVEKTFEEHLRGEKGAQYFVVDKFNREKGSYKDGKKDIPGMQGKNLQLTIDVKAQEYARQLMQNKIGSLVAIEPATGEILAMVSSPDYNPTMLTTRERGEVVKAMRNDPLKRELNRCITAYYPPGSTFKPVTALIGLQEGVIHRNSYMKCGMYYPISSGSGVRCSHAHPSPGNVMYAIEQSCNPYFCEVFRRTLDNPEFNDVDTTFKRWYSYVRDFGFGDSPDIGIPGGISGNVPSAQYFDKIYDGWRWKAKTVISLSIGQGELAVTPLQMAQAVATIANRGKFAPAHIYKTKDAPPSRQIDIEARHFETVIDGMEQVMTKGTGRGSQIEGVATCGKTGTAENHQGNGKDHSIFVFFAPKDDPKIAIAAVIENGGYGSTVAAPIATLVAEKYLNDTISKKRKWRENKILEMDLITEALEADAEKNAEKEKEQ